MIIPENLLRRLDTPGPRYTSYPTADRFVDSFGESEYRQALLERTQKRAGEPASVYVHVPFCESVCYYCACNKIVTRHHDRATDYLKALEQEIGLHRAALGAAQPIAHLHFGGGTPTFLNDDELHTLLGSLKTAFYLTPDAEVSIEVDPRTASPSRLQALADMGFNRLSFGIQDFDAAVQKAVHRVQPFEMVQDLMHAARTIGFDSINADLIYGLPLQTAESFARTVGQISALRPDRIALYAYAHLPTRFKPQRRIDDHQLPTAADRLKMLGGAIEGFLSHGYTYIGMDHFALPSDRLAIAKREGSLHRNFQGYTTRPDNDLIGLGVSAIGSVGTTYSQNAKTLAQYYDALKLGHLPIVRGLNTTSADRLRRSVIMALMCQGRVSFSEIDTRHSIVFGDYFASELDRLTPLLELGAAEIDADTIQVTPLGWYVVRGIAMIFDRYLQSDREPQTDRKQTMFSRVI